MAVEDAARLDGLGLARRWMVARLATVSGSGRPSINPLYYVFAGSRLWLGTSDWTLAARNVAANPSVVVLFEDERSRDPRVVRARGRATVRTDPEAVRAYSRAVARKYVLTPAGVRDLVAHWRLLPLRRRYYAGSASKGRACVIEVVPEQVDILTDPLRA